MSDLAMRDLLTVNDYDDKISALREIREKLTLCAAHRDDTLTALQAENERLTKLVDEMQQELDENAGQACDLHQRAERAESALVSMIERLGRSKAERDAWKADAEGLAKAVQCGASGGKLEKEALAAHEKLKGGSVMACAHNWYSGVCLNCGVGPVEMDATIARLTAELAEARENLTRQQDRLADVMSKVHRQSSGDHEADIRRAVEAETRACIAVVIEGHAEEREMKEIEDALNARLDQPKAEEKNNGD